MAITFVITNAGRAALVNAANTGTAPVTIAQAGLSSAAVTPSPTTANLPGEFKRIGTLSGDIVADDTIHLIVRDESSDVFTLRSIALYLADGTLFGIYGQSEILLEKSSQALMLLAVDIRFEDVAAGNISFGDANFLNPPATTERQGVIELATVPEAQVGIDALRALTPYSARAAILGWLLAQDGAGSGLDADMLDGQHASTFLRRLMEQWNTDADGNQRFYFQALANGGRTFLRYKSQFVLSPADGVAPFTVDETGNINATGTANIDGRLTTNSIIVSGAAGSNGLSGGTGDGASYTTYNMTVNAHWGIGFRAFDGAVNGFYDARSGIWDVKTGYLVNGNVVWNAANDGAGSGLDADLLDGQQGSYYADIAARLGYSPVRQGGGIGQASNRVYIGWSGAGRLKATVDSLDLGNIAFDANIAGGILDINGAAMRRNGYQLFGPDNDGSGSGLDADLLDGVQGSNYARTDLASGAAFAGAISAPSLWVAGGAQIGGVLTAPTFRVLGGFGANGLSAGNGDGASYSTYNVALDCWFGLGMRGPDNVVNGYYDARSGIWDVKTGYRVNGNVVWNAANDGAGSGLDADMLDGEHGSAFMRRLMEAWNTDADGNQRFYFQALANGGRTFLRYKSQLVLAAGDDTTPVTIDEAGNIDTGGSYRRAGNNVWDSGNDGSGSGLDADLLDGVQGSSFARIDLPSGASFAGEVAAPALRSTGSATVDGQILANSIVVTGAAGSNGLSGGTGDGASYTSYNMTVNAHWGIGFRAFDGTVNGFYDARSGIWDVKAGYRVNGNVVWHVANDGAGSGLDADMLDGEHGGAFMRRQIEAWNTDADGNQRFYFQALPNGGRTYLRYKSQFVLTPTDGATAFTIDEAGNVEASGSYRRAGNNVWDSGNDGSGSGLDADLLDGQDGGYYADIVARLGFLPVQQGGGNGQSTNKIFIGWDGNRLRAQVDNADQGPLVTDDKLQNGGLDINGGQMRRNGNQVWGPDNDGSGSGLDADLLDGFQADAFNRVVAQNMAAIDGYRVYADGTKECWTRLSIGQHQHATWNLPVAHESFVHPSLGCSTAGGNTEVQDNTGITSVNGVESISFWNADDRTITVWVRTIGR